MKIDRWKHYKKMCKKYGLFRWHLLILFSPILFALLFLAKTLKAIGLVGEYLELKLEEI